MNTSLLKIPVQSQYQRLAQWEHQEVLRSMKRYQVRLMCTTHPEAALEHKSQQNSRELLWSNCIHKLYAQVLPGI